MAMDLVIEVRNEPGALARVAQAISDAGVNIAAATCLGANERAELHILVPNAEPVRHALALSHLAVTSEREVVVVETDDRPGALAELATKVAAGDVNIDLVYVALPPSAHLEWCTAALKSGKHVLVEKPFASNARDAERMERRERTILARLGFGDPYARAE